MKWKGHVYQHNQSYAHFHQSSMKDTLSNCRPLGDNETARCVKVKHHKDPGKFRLNTKRRFADRFRFLDRNRLMFMGLSLTNLERCLSFFIPVIGGFQSLQSHVSFVNQVVLTIFVSRSMGGRQWDNHIQGVKTRPYRRTRGIYAPSKKQSIFQRYLSWRLCTVYSILPPRHRSVCPGQYLPCTAQIHQQHLKNSCVFCYCFKWWEL